MASRGALHSPAVRFVAAAGAVFGVALAAPMACLFPSYSDFTLSGGAGGSGPGTTSPSSAATASGMATSTTGTATSMATTTTGGGGSTTTSTVASSTGGPPCASMDCMDPTCKDSYACVPTQANLPSGWTGYFALYDGSASGLPPCPTLFPTQQPGALNGGFTAPAPTTCTCTCGTPAGGTCQIPELDISDASCTGTAVCTGPIVPPAGYTAGKCFNFPDPTSGYDEFGGSVCGTQSMTMGTICNSGTSPCNVSAATGDGTVTGSSCAPSATTTNAPPVTWGSTAQACGGATMGTGCGTSDACMPIPPGPFVSGICIMQAADVACPGGQFTDKHLLYSGTNDTRSCDACTCGAATGDSCEVEWQLYSDSTSPPSCQKQVLSVDSAQMCVAFSMNPNVTSAKATITAPPNGGMCSPIDGTPTGSISPSGAVTYCCVP